MCDTLGEHTLIGYYIPDFVVDGKVVIEIKALKSIENSHIAQVIGYLAVNGCSVGLLINFGERSLVHRSILSPRNLQQHQANRQWLFVPDWLKSTEAQSPIIRSIRSQKSADSGSLRKRRSGMRRASW